MFKLVISYIYKNRDIIFNAVAGAIDLHIQQKQNSTQNKIITTYTLQMYLININKHNQIPKKTPTQNKINITGIYE